MDGATVLITRAGPSVLAVMFLSSKPASMLGNEMDTDLINPSIPRRR